MEKLNKTYDIFLSYSLELQGDAKVVSEKFAESNLIVFDVHDLGPNYNIEEEMWKALAESWALIVLIKPGIIPPSIAIELGAAAAWHKSIYVVTTSKGKYHLPAYFSQYEIINMSEISNLITLISNLRKPLSEKDRDSLKNAYFRLRIPADQLIREPKYINMMQKMLHNEYGISISNERMMQELLRLRKTGKLPKTRK